MLATTQSDWVGDALRAGGAEVELVIVRTEGDDLSVPLDAPSRPGAFVAVLRDVLAAGDVDLVVHSFKDLPSAPLPGLRVAAVPARQDPADVLVTRDGRGLEDLEPGARVGTSSPRRAVALTRRRPDLEIVPLRGNVDTRVAAVTSGRVDAVVLAAAGLRRLGRSDVSAVALPSDVLLPAPAQGALAVECRSVDADVCARVAALDDPLARLTVTAERAVLAGVEAQCTTAVGALATYEGGVLAMQAELSNHAGVSYRRVSVAVEVSDPSGGLDAAEALGERAAAELLGR